MREAGALVRARHARSNRRLLRQQEQYVFNGLYQQKFIQAPILTRDELLFRAVVLAIAVPVAFFASLGLAFLIRGALR